MRKISSCLVKWKWLLVGMCYSFVVSLPVQASGTQIILMGDSVLDDFYWLENPKNDLTAQLEKLCYPTRNFAVDESKIKDIIAGKEPRQPYVEKRKELDVTPYPTDEDGLVKPLHLLAKEVKNYAGETYVVISVGGNDFALQSHTRASISEEFQKIQEGYAAIIQAIKEKGNKNTHTLFVMPYLPCLADDAFFNSEFSSGIEGIEDLITLYRHFFQIIATLARENGCSIIDLSRTFNPYDKGDYGIYPNTGKTTPIEPSNISSQYIADLIHNAIQKQNSDGSKIYYGRKPTIEAYNNTRDLNKDYIEALKKITNPQKNPTQALKKITNPPKKSTQSGGTSAFDFVLKKILPLFMIGCLLLILFLNKRKLKIELPFMKRKNRKTQKREQVDEMDAESESV